MCGANTRKVLARREDPGANSFFSHTDFSNSEFPHFWTAIPSGRPVSTCRRPVSACRRPVSASRRPVSDCRISASASRRSESAFRTMSPEI